jgi:hypothetical protein
VRHVLTLLDEAVQRFSPAEVAQGTILRPLAMKQIDSERVQELSDGLDDYWPGSAQGV